MKALVLAGGKGWFYDELFRLVEELGLSRQVHFPGFIPQAELPDWYRAAELFVYPSRFEGFGLPVLEAMQCGKSGVISGVSSLPEVAGDTALYADPMNPEDIADKLSLFTSDSAGRSRLELAAVARAAQFSWNKAAGRMVDIFRKSV